MIHLLLQQFLAVGRSPHIHSPIHRSISIDKDLTPQERSPSTAGFSILEVIVVMVIVGLLGAIAAPSWLALVNRQRLNATRDEVVQAIRTTQGNAKQRRSSQKLVFDEIKFESDGVDPDSIEMTVTDNSGQTISELEFVQDGTIVTNDASNFTLPFKIVLSPTNSGAKRCIFVESLLGSVRLEADGDCS
ncbi:MAG: type II secretion system protein [Merismopedia sp. SIO2A8]|nr:type II secretion system protein [Merismopedia sp. SIO2A8]